MLDIENSGLVHVLRHMLDIEHHSGWCASRVIGLTLKTFQRGVPTVTFFQVDARISLTPATQGRGQRAQHKHHGVCRAHTQ